MMRQEQSLRASKKSLVKISRRRDTRSHAIGIALAAALTALHFTSIASAVTIGSGFSAMWYDQARSGEGLQLEILDANNALVEWYTYDEQGGPRWLQGVGQIVHDPAGDSIEFSQRYDTHAGRLRHRISSCSAPSPRALPCNMFQCAHEAGVPGNGLRMSLCT